MQSAGASILINEMMPRNVSYLINEKFNFVGWVELYNNGAENFDLSQCLFSDGKDTWESKATGTLEPGGYALFYFDELNSTNHASFKLDADGGVLSLITKDGIELDKVVYRKSYRNVSFGREVDGGQTIGMLAEPTPGRTNDVTVILKTQAAKPTFDLEPGFYKGEQTVSIVSPVDSATIYYTLDGSEPKVGISPVYAEPITMSANTPLRAIAVEDGKLASDITTATYFINEREISLPIISIVTDRKFFYDDSIGMLVVGKNGAKIPTGCGSSYERANYMNDWDRPCNFEYFDKKSKTEQLNLIVKSEVAGGCSRNGRVKTLKINANKTYGVNKLEYPIFRQKPNLQLKSVILRNSGNDIAGSHIRDGFMQSLLEGQMDMDYQAFEPSVVFVNGEYYGMLNIRERSNKDNIYSNYGLDEDDIYIVDPLWSKEYKDLVRMMQDGGPNEEGKYEQIDSLIDINEFLNYFMSEIYFANEDWPDNNWKAWKRIENGKWRWILYDTDMGYRQNYDIASFDEAYGNHIYQVVYRNKKVRLRFVSKFVVHLATTFKPERCVHILDSIASYVKDEALFFHQNVFGKDSLNWEKQIESMRVFAKKRPAFVYLRMRQNLGLKADASFRVYSDNPAARYLFNEEPVNISDLQTRFYNGLDVNLTAKAPDGYRFKHWEISGDSIADGVVVDTSAMLSTTFLGATTYKAVFEEDSTWNKDIPNLYLNEICSTNKQYIDEYRESDDWIEVYNDGSSPVNIGGMYVSDARNNLTKFQIADTMPQQTTIPAGGYLVIWADGQPEQGVLHTNFKLSSTKQQTVSLSKMVGEELVVIDSIRYRIHAKGETFARFAYEGEGSWTITSLPTFLAENKFAARLKQNVVEEDEDKKEDEKVDENPDTDDNTDSDVKDDTDDKTDDDTDSDVKDDTDDKTDDDTDSDVKDDTDDKTDDDTDSDVKDDTDDKTDDDADSDVKDDTDDKTDDDADSDVKDDTDDNTDGDADSDVKDDTDDKTDDNTDSDVKDDTDDKTDDNTDSDVKDDTDDKTDDDADSDVKDDTDDNTDGDTDSDVKDDTDDKTDDNTDSDVKDDTDDKTDDDTDSDVKDDTDDKTDGDTDSDVKDDTDDKMDGDTDSDVKDDTDDKTDDDTDSDVKDDTDKGDDDVIITGDEFVLSGDSKGVFAYPNPTSDFLHLQLPWESESLVKVRNGVRVILESTLSPSNEIDVSQFAAGFYLAEIHNKKTGEMLVVKFVKK